MTTETSRNADYAPYGKGQLQQAPVPQAVHNLPGTVAASSSVSTSLIRTDGFALISAGLTMTQNGNCSVQRFLDDGGTQPQGAPVTAAVLANVAANLDILDGKPFSSFQLTVTNITGSTATISGFALLLQTGAANQIDTANDGSGAITAGGTAQTLFGGVVPSNGFYVCNPDATNDLWLALGATAAANGQGSIRVAANGGYYATEPGLKPWQPVSIVGAVTAQKFSAARW
ncbi:MAG: hypothetical protein P4M15_13455 [Alphaproteobacteria bacterium]|nr:hypothetical protein [Alphaproteobacteria bacterium]